MQFGFCFKEEEVKKGDSIRTEKKLTLHPSCFLFQTKLGLRFFSLQVVKERSSKGEEVTKLPDEDSAHALLMKRVQETINKLLFGDNLCLSISSRKGCLDYKHEHKYEIS